MPFSDAENKVREAALSFSRLIDKQRAQGPFAVSASEFQAVLIDLDAALPGLSGVMEGRALVMKAHALFLWHSAKNDSLLYEPPPQSLLDEGLACATKGRKIMQDLNDTKNLGRADEMVETFRH